jgi:hypothetical protein
MTDAVRGPCYENFVVGDHVETRSLMAFRPDAPELEDLFPGAEQPWSVPSEPAMST